MPREALCAKNFYSAFCLTLSQIFHPHLAIVLLTVHGGIPTLLPSHLGQKTSRFPFFLMRGSPTFSQVPARCLLAENKLLSQRATPAQRVLAGFAPWLQLTLQQLRRKIAVPCTPLALQNQANLGDLHEIKYRNAVISFLMLEEPWSLQLWTRRGPSGPGGVRRARHSQTFVCHRRVQRDGDPSRDTPGSLFLNKWTWKHVGYEHTTPRLAEIIPSQPAQPHPVQGDADPVDLGTAEVCVAFEHRHRARQDAWVV